MRRTLFTFWALLLCGLGLGALALGGYGQATASIPANQTPGGHAPLIPCIYTPVQFSLFGMGIIEARRPFTTTADESYVQFVPAQPLTTTAASSGYALLNGGWSGNVAGNITGTFSAPNLNGYAITASTASQNALGIEVNEIVIRGATGMITALLATNFASWTPMEPFYPRSISGYLHSTSTSGSYAPYRFAGTLTGNIGQPSGGVLPVIATVTGRLYTGGAGPLSGVVNGSRDLPGTRQVIYAPIDIIAQFVRPDFPAPGKWGNIDAGSVFTGITTIVPNGRFSMDHNSLLVESGAGQNDGWLAANFRVVDGSGNTLSGPWLTDRQGGGAQGYFFTTEGTGLYADSLVYGQYIGAISYNGGRDLAVGMGGGGVFCSGFVPAQTPTPEATASATHTSTSTPAYTTTPTPYPSATGIGACSCSLTGATSSCIAPSTYNYSFEFYTYCASHATLYGYYTLFFEVAGSSWVEIDREYHTGSFPFGTSYQTGTMSEIIPSKYTWWRIRLDGYVSGGPSGQIHIEGQTPSNPSCSPPGTFIPTRTPTSTPTPYITLTPTFTLTPRPAFCADYYYGMTTGVSLIPGTSCARCDGYPAHIDLPFTYYLYGIPFDNAIVSQTGNLEFRGFNVSGINSCLPHPDFDNVIMAYWDRLQTYGDNCPPGGCGIFTSTIGIAPNRIFVIEWRALYWEDSQPANFEALLYEGQSRFDIIYGEISHPGTSATVGVQRDQVHYTQYECNSGGVFQGLQLSFYLPSCGTPTPTPPQPTVTPTLTPTGGTPRPTDTPTRTLTPTPCAPCATNTPTITTTPCNITFSDVHPPDYFYTPVMYLACHGVISGYADGTFRPYNNTTRGQMCKIVVLAEGWPLDCSLPGHFTDVPPSDPFYCYIETLYRHNRVVVGYDDGTFRPYNHVTRGQLCKIVVLAEEWADDCPLPGHFSDVPPGSAFYCYIETAYSHGVVSGYSDGTFRPGNPATRGQICKIVYQALQGIRD